MEAGDSAWCLANPHGDRLVYVEQTGQHVELDLPSDTTYRLHWIDAKTSEVSSVDVLSADQAFRVPAKTNVLWLERIQID
jgi:hypothetical protein